MRTVGLPDGMHVPALGQGIWRMGENKRHRAIEVEALRLGIELGMSLIDTAEMYGDGGAEEIIREAIQRQRSDVFIVTKVYPHNASHEKLPKACERSPQAPPHRCDRSLSSALARANATTPGNCGDVQKLRAAGKIRRWGVSNFDVDDLEELFSLKHGRGCAANQVLYNLENREIELDLLPRSQKTKSQSSRIRRSVTAANCSETRSKEDRTIP